MSDCLGVTQIERNDLTEEELKAFSDVNNNGILSCRIIPYAQLNDETLETIFQYSKDNVEWLLKTRPDFVQRKHSDILN